MALAVAGEAGPVIRAVPYLVAAGIYSLFHILLLSLGATPMSAGDLAGPDSYMRLVRVTQLYETGAWFDGFMARSNAPFGHDLHWTRPFDVILLSGAWLASSFWGFESALFRWGSLSSPVFHVALGLAAVWATAPIFDVWRRCL
jgi:asparagine N-glycosylation enzyme membrane subunit Stt3